MLEYSLRALKKKTDKGLCLTKITAPNCYRADIEGNRPASCLFMSDLQCLCDALLGYRFGVVRETLQPQDTREARSGGDPMVNFISVQSDPGRRRAVCPQSQLKVFSRQCVSSDVTERAPQYAVSLKFGHH